MFRFGGASLLPSVCIICGSLLLRLLLLLLFVILCFLFLRLAFFAVLFFFVFFSVLILPVRECCFFVSAFVAVCVSFACVC